MVTRSVRLARTLDENLKEEARREGLTVNALVALIVDEYQQRQRIARRFPLVSLPLDVLKSVWESLDDDSLVKLARQEGRKITKDVILFWFKEANLQNFMAYLALLSKYQGFGHFETEDTGENIMVIARHGMGKKWSIWIKNYLTEGIRSSLDVTPQVEESPDSVVFKFPKTGK